MCRAFPGHVIVGLDAKDGLVATDGWAEVSEQKATELAKRFEQDGVSSIVYTDIARDGMMQGDRKSTRLNSSHVAISYAVFCLKKKTAETTPQTTACYEPLLC